VTALNRYPRTSSLTLLARHRRMRQRIRAAVAGLEARLELYREELERRANAAYPFVLVHCGGSGKRYYISGGWPDADHAIRVHELDATWGMSAHTTSLHANLHEFIVTRERLPGR
jgi:hypothetical protein